MSLNLVPDIHNFWRWWSVRLALLSSILTAVALAYASLPYDWVYGIPAWIKTALGTGALLSALGSACARAVLQPKLPTAQDPPA